MEKVPFLAEGGRSLDAAAGGEDGGVVAAEGGADAGEAVAPGAADGEEDGAGVGDRARPVVAEDVEGGYAEEGADGAKFPVVSHPSQASLLT